MTIKINMGCGDNPTKGYKSYDNSITTRIKRFSYFNYIIWELGLYSKTQYDFISYLSNTDIL